MINLFEYQNKVSFPEKHFDDLEIFLDTIWNKREKSSYYNEEENREEVQHFIQFLHKNKELKSNKFVGVIHFEDQTINLLPKIFHTGTEPSTDEVKTINSHVLWWLSYCRKLNFPNYPSGLNTQQADFFEILIYLFSKYTKELLNSSVYQKYVEVENELSFVKGRMNFNEYINQNLARGRNHKVNCIYDSFEMDNPFNQCIKYVSKMLLSATKDQQNKRNLNDIIFVLDEVSDEYISSAACKNIQFNPMLKEIKDVNPKGQAAGTYLDEEKSFGLKPDLILDLGYKKIIADTKYKMVYAESTDTKKGISQSDLYQMLAYAIRFGITDIKLFYPNTKAQETATDLKTIEIVDTLANSINITIQAHQVTILDKTITVTDLNQSKLSDCFERLKLKLIAELETILK